MTAIIIITLLLLGIAAYFLFGSRDKSEVTKNAETDAQRLAKLLVSEIKLYQTYKFERGLKNNNLYESLSGEIEEAREKYKKRFPGVEFSKFFDEALIDVLASGDKSMLGLISNSLN